MRRTTLIAALALVAAALPSTASARDGRGYVPGELIVKFRPGVPAAERAAALGDRGARVQRALPGRTALVRLPPRAEAPAAATALERDERVAWAEPNAYRVGGAVPDDRLFAQQWGLHNSGQQVAGAVGVADADIDAPEAWARTTGSPTVRVAVVDSGINLAQPDLAPSIATNPSESGGGREHNGVDDDGNGLVDDWRGWDFVQQDNDPSDNHGHGTHVAGIVAARGDNGIGVAGVAWRSSVIPVRVLDNLNVGTCAEIAAGMAYAVRAGARIVNVSIGGELPCQLERHVIDHAPDTLFVVAAMNDTTDVDAHPVYPCAFPSPNIVCVAATDSRDRLAAFSNFGARSVDLAAPGDDVMSAYLKWEPKQSLFTDGFESPLGGRWVTGGSGDQWGRTLIGQRTGGWALTDSPFGEYADGTDSVARLTEGLDFTGKRDCAAGVWVKRALDSQDALLVETSPDGVSWGRRIDAVFGTAGYERWLIDLSELEGRATGGFRFRLVTDSGGTAEGVTLDDLELFCVPPVQVFTGADDEFALDWGTSMATPHVTGVAALLLAVEPRLSPAGLKQRLLSTVDPLPGLAGRTVSGGRLNAAKAVAVPVAAPQPAPAPQRAPAAPAGSAGPPGGAGVEAALAGDLAKLAEALAARRIGALLRRGGVAARDLHAVAPGAAALVVTRRGGKRIAAGTRAVGRAGPYSVTAALTKRGRAALRRARRLRLNVALAFAPLSGRAVVRSTTVTVRR